MTIFLMVLVVAGTATEQPAWPAFLGAGSKPNASQLPPLTWSPTENIAWRASLPGHGQSSPVVWNDRVYVTSVEGPNKETYHTLCLDLASGKPLWKQTLANTSPVKNSYYVSRAAPTPTVDKEGVYVMFESGDCVAYTLDGTHRWTRQLSKEEGPITAEFGLGASPCQDAQRFFVLMEHEGPSCLLAIDKNTGETVWKLERESRRSWASPTVMRFAGRPQVVVSSSGTIDGYDCETGDLLWSFDDIGGNTATTPIDQGDGTFLVGASAGRNGENASSSVDSNCQIRVQLQQGKWVVTKNWVAEKATPTWASPITHAGLSYWINRAGVVFCVDAATGEAVYSERIAESSWATPIGIGDRVYFFGKEGKVTVLQAGREFKVLAENVSWDDDTLPTEASLASADESPERQRAAAMFSRPTLYAATLTGETILLRVGHQLFCVRQAD